jgi:hypothetical protein
MEGCYGIPEQYFDDTRDSTMNKSKKALVLSVAGTYRYHFFLISVLNL